MSDSQMNSLKKFCDESISKGSLSFSMASRLFPADARMASHFVYAWCRFCDDQIDQVDLMDLSEGEKRKEQIRRLEGLSERTRSAIAGKADADPVFQAFQWVVRRYKIPEHYPLELLQGMAMDVNRTRYQTTDDLELYCFRVASVVGLMMVHVMGVSSERALKHASDMGMAMQMTNIARDVLEDARMGRVYFPRDWLKEVGLLREDVSKPEHRQKVLQLTRRLLNLADSYYASGGRGISYLPVRAAFAITAASFIYSEIGRKVLARGVYAWDTRTVVTTGRKLALAAQAVFKVLLMVPKRIFRPWSAAPIKVVWRFS